MIAATWSLVFAVYGLFTAAIWSSQHNSLGVCLTQQGALTIVLAIIFALASIE